MKKKLQGMKFRPQNKVISAVTGILPERPVRTLSGVFDQSNERLHGTLQTVGSMSE
jgi:hypothetical protein